MTPTARHGLRLLIGTVGFAPWLLFVAGWSGDIAHLAFDDFCHQLPTRSLHGSDQQMVVCSRCAGLYLGLGLGTLVPLPDAYERWGPRLVLLGGLAMVLDVVTQDLGLHAPWHPSRLLTGLSFGWPLGAWVTGLLLRDQSSRSSSAS